MLDIKQPRQVYQFSTSIYQAYKDNNNESKQYTNTNELREMSNRKYRRIVSKFEPLALRPRLHRNEEFSL